MVSDLCLTVTSAYDKIGNLTQDIKGGNINADGIEWNVYGKISKITKINGNTITYTYDAAGNRISKTYNATNTANPSTSTGGKTTWYVRDAQGNVLSIYELNAGEGSHLMQKEVDIYGSSRLGILNRNINMEAAAPLSTDPVIFERGNKLFELSNHLGNVSVNITDKKLLHSSDGGVTSDYYEADVATASDY